MPIPKTIHIIWLGPLKIPNTVKTLYETHPNWDIKIWKDKDLESFPMINREIFDSNDRRYNQKSDIARLEILYKYGGIYIDADILMLQNMDNLCRNDIELFLVQEKQGLLSNSIIGSSKENKIVSGIIKHIQNTFVYDKAVWKTTGPGCLTQYLVDKSHIVVPQSSIKYDITSIDDSLIIYPYYYFNIMYDTIRNFRSRVLKGDIDDISVLLSKNNRDIKYKKNNEINIKKIYGVQLWMGGKKKLYKLNLNVQTILTNIEKYKNYLCLT